jgi:transcriptional regulator with XRE-family HTH domain
VSVDGDLSTRFRLLREQAGYTQAEFAAIVGVEQPHIARFEAGAYDRATITTLRHFARALGYELAVFFVRATEAGCDA